MAETQTPSIGWGGEFWFHDGTAPYEAVEVKSFSLPNDESEDVETTHLKSPGRRRTYINGLIPTSSVEVVINYRPGSDTDIKLRAWRAANESREIKFGIPMNGEVAWEIETFGTCKGIDRGDVTADGLLEATVSVRIDDEQDEAAAA